jgi:hypothetical protein
VLAVIVTAVAAIAAATPVPSPPASAAPASAPPAGTYRYLTTLDGAVIGRSTLVVTTSNPAGITVSEDSSGVLAGQDVAARATLHLDGDLAPSEYTALYRTPQGTLQTEARVTARDVHLLTDGRDQIVSLPPNGTHLVVLDGALLAGFFVLPAQMHAWNATTLLALVPVYGQAVPATSVPASPQRPSSVPARDLALSVQAIVPFVEWYDPVTMVPDEIDVPSQQLVMRRSDS